MIDYALAAFARLASTGFTRLIGWQKQGVIDAGLSNNLDAMVEQRKHQFSMVVADIVGAEISKDLTSAKPIMKGADQIGGNVVLSFQKSKGTASVSIPSSRTKAF